MTSVYKKTPLGRQMFAERSALIGRAERNFLIMVDGKKTLTELSNLLAGGNPVTDIVARMLDLGCIELEVTALAAPPVVKPADEPRAITVPVPVAALPFEQVKKLASRLLTDALGPQAEGLCMVIERSKTPEMLLAAVERGASTLSTVRGQKASETFLAATGQRLAMK